MKVGYISDDIYLMHDIGNLHTESKERLISIEDTIVNIKQPILGSISLHRKPNKQKNTKIDLNTPTVFRSKIVLK